MLTVKERGHFAATIRFMQVWLMETLAAWVPTTPEMEVKLLFGEHIWDAAQHADALGKRTFELRLPLQHSQRPADAYVAFLAELAAVRPTAQRIAAVYDVFLPALAARYRRYLERTDHLSDAPTVRILERDLADTARMVEAARALRQELPALQLTDPQWAETLRRREAAFETVVAAGAPVAVEA
jgi:hypothetical protein